MQIITNDKSEFCSLLEDVLFEIKKGAKWKKAKNKS